MTSPTAPASPVQLAPLPGSQPCPALAAHRVTTVAMLVLLLLTAAVTLYIRIAGPSDVYDKDQAKTMSYTVDVVLNGNWALPRDSIRQYATKPPLYNWLAAPVPAVFGVWDEWAHKLPSLVAGLATLLITASFARRLFSRLDDDRMAALAMPLALLSATFWLASYPTQELIYLARPDMLLTAFLAGAWMLGDEAMEADLPPRRRNRLAAGFWICVAGAALTKGPAAAIPLVYVLLSARLVHGRWSAVDRLRWRWGLGGVLGVLVAWGIFAAIANPEHFGEKLLLDEFILRLLGGPPEEGVHGKPFWHVIFWFKRDFLPWSVFATAGGLIVLIGGWKQCRWRFHPLLPAAMWSALVMASIAISRGKRADYLAPMYPAASILAAFAIIFFFRAPSRRRLQAPIILAGGVGALAVALGLGYWRWHVLPEAVTMHGEHLLAFRDRIKPILGDDDHLLFLIRGYQPLLPLMGRFEGRRPSVEQLEHGRWLITRLDPRHRWPPVAVSDEVSGILRGIYPDQLALYDLHASPRPTMENLLELYALEDPLVRRSYEGEGPPLVPPDGAAPATQPAPAPP